MPCRPLRWLQATRLATRGEATRPGCYLVLTSSSSLDSTALRLQACKAGCDCNRGPFLLKATSASEINDEPATLGNGHIASWQQLASLSMTLPGGGVN
uniref:Uncharacterized protein n=1 Tax=Oryza glumipatula TaxID=40148 RepID=A0A0D9ZBZ5_9ORYZ